VLELPCRQRLDGCRRELQAAEETNPFTTGHASGPSAS
jgi:hypothetical protein